MSGIRRLITHTPKLLLLRQFSVSATIHVHGEICNKKNGVKKLARLDKNGEPSKRKMLLMEKSESISSEATNVKYSDIKNGRDKSANTVYLPADILKSKSAKTNSTENRKNKTGIEKKKILPTDVKHTVTCDQSSIKEESSSVKDSLIHIDNAKWSDAPEQLNCNKMLNFPLSFPNEHLQVGVNISENEKCKLLLSQEIGQQEAVTSIGIFEGGYSRLPSVSKILENTMLPESRLALETWKAKLIKELGEDGFAAHQQDLFSRGKKFHQVIQNELSGITTTTADLECMEGLWTSLQHVLSEITTARILESRVIHPYLHYQGAVDCVANYKGMPVLIEWKSSNRTKSTLKMTYDNPLQVAAYMGAFNVDNAYRNHSSKAEVAMLVIAYEMGQPAQVHMLRQDKCEQYWKLWCQRVVEFWRQFEIK